MTVEHRDIAGNAVTVGNIIVYAALWDRSATLRYGRVVALATRTTNQPGVVKPTVRAITVDRGHDGVWNLQKDGGQVTLGFLDRLLVVHCDQVPPGALEILIKHA
jgi:hypothetical protein